MMRCTSSCDLFEVERHQRHDALPRSGGVLGVCCRNVSATWSFYSIRPLTVSSATVHRIATVAASAFQPGPDQRRATDSTAAKLVEPLHGAMQPLSTLLHGDAHIGSSVPATIDSLASSTVQRINGTQRLVSWHTTGDGAPCRAEGEPLMATEIAAPRRRSEKSRMAIVTANANC